MTAVVDAPPEVLVSQALRGADEEVHHMGRPYVPAVPDQIGNLVDDTESVIQVWSLLLEKIHTVIQLVDDIAEIHPYAKMAWSIVSIIPKTFIAQIHRDDAIVTLLESLDGMCACIDEVKDLQANQPQQKIIAQMTCQIIECASFIKNYAENHNFGRRLFANLSIFSNTDEQIRSYNSTIQSLQQALQAKTILQSGIGILHILDVVQNQAAIIDLNDIPYASGAKYQMEKLCLPGTRKDIIDSICEWVNNEDNKTPRVMFLAGVAGSGKSAIAHTVAQIFHELKLLGSSFFFDQSKAAVLHPGILFSTIARDLADLDPYFKIKLSEATQERAKRTTSSVSEQFEEFLVKPASQLQRLGPVLIVIDALDESGDSRTRKTLLSILANRVQNLPHNFRFFVTGRPEPDIAQALCPSEHVIKQDMSSVSPVDIINKDIFQFVKASLDAFKQTLDNKWPNDGWTHHITKKANGLFQWAFTAREFISNFRAGQTAVGQLEIILHSSSNSKRFIGLDGLYRDVLQHSLAIDEESAMSKYRAVMGTIFAVREPLSASALQILQQQDTDVKSIISFLGAVLTGVTNDNDPMQPLHISFRDFITNKEHSGEFHVEVNAYEQHIGMTCLQIMKSELRFNICELENSYQFNHEMADLKQRMGKCISAHLSYTCTYWMDHLSSTSNKAEDIIKAITEFLHNHLLWWIEVMALKQDITMMKKQLQQLNQWSDVTFAKDTLQFIDTFAEGFMQSIPHLYLSALAFTPICSLVGSQYTSSY
ncbi:hypothetical protein BJ138DRAFT_1193733, partial [Hygrophoropsis aurantiaca]